MDDSRQVVFCFAVDALQTGPTTAGVKQNMKSLVLCRVSQKHQLCPGHERLLLETGGNMLQTRELLKILKNTKPLVYVMVKHWD
jgi:hypothetical protein